MTPALWAQTMFLRPNVRKGGKVTSHLGIFESVVGDIFAGSSGNDFEVFDDSGHDFVLQTGVLSFSVFSDSDDINIVVDESLDTWDGLARSHIGIETQFLPESDVDASVAL